MERFAEEPVFKHLIRINPGISVGNWRDSAAGIGWGTYPGDVNVFLAPESLQAMKTVLENVSLVPEDIGEITGNGELDHISCILEHPSILDKLMKIWSAARKTFLVRFTPDEVRDKVNTYLSSFATGEEREYYRSRSIDGISTVGDFLDGARTPAVLRDGIAFTALSLKDDGLPVAVMNSDIGFDLFFGSPSPGEIRQILALLNLPFPLGLSERGGILVANPVYAADTSLRKTLGNTAYHGTVVWAWHHSLITEGLVRQILRFKNDPDKRELVREMIGTIRNIQKMEEAAGELVNSELWTHTFVNGWMVPSAYGVDQESETVSNAVQLWSSVGLAVMQQLDELDSLMEKRNAPLPEAY